MIATAVGAKKVAEGQDYFLYQLIIKKNITPQAEFLVVILNGRLDEAETLISRLIDRPIRPLFPSGFMNEVQVSTVLSYDSANQPDILSIASSAALAVSGLPFLGPIAASRVGYKDGKYLLNPSVEEIKDTIRFSSSWN